MCDEEGPYATGWDVMIEYRAFELLVDARPMHVSELARRLRLSRPPMPAEPHSTGSVGSRETCPEPSTWA
jgi:hypothetical protein